MAFSSNTPTERLFVDCFVEAEKWKDRGKKVHDARTTTSNKFNPSVTPSNNNNSSGLERQTLSLLP